LDDNSRGASLRHFRSLALLFVSGLLQALCPYRRFVA
jgi:hypothetical protein